METREHEKQYGPFKTRLLNLATNRIDVLYADMYETAEDIGFDKTVVTSDEATAGSCALHPDFTEKHHLYHALLQETHDLQLYCTLPGYSLPSLPKISAIAIADQAYPVACDEDFYRVLAVSNPRVTTMQTTQPLPPESNIEQIYNHLKGTGIYRVFQG